jgi:hypothetical protein
MFQFDRPQAHRMIRLRRRCNDLVVALIGHFATKSARVTANIQTPAFWPAKLMGPSSLADVHNDELAINNRAARAGYQAYFWYEASFPTSSPQRRLTLAQVANSPSLDSPRIPLTRRLS